MNDIDFIYNTMKDITNKTPILLVGGASILFKRMYKGNIYRLDNTDDTRDFISNFYKIEYDKPIIVEDISKLYKDSILLKLIEEIKLPIVLLASEDNISTTLQSRIKTYIKLPSDKELGCSYNKILDTQQYIIQENINGKDLDKYLAEHCPDLAIINNRTKKCRNKDKIVQILGGLYDNKH